MNRSRLSILGVLLLSALLAGAACTLLDTDRSREAPMVFTTVSASSGEHFYGFVEHTYGPTALCIHCGMGWRF